MELLASLMTVALLQAAGVATTPPSPFWTVVRPNDVCRMSGSWIIGLGHPQASVTNVNIERIEDRGRMLIQALHRGVMTSPTGDDQFLVDAATLHPVETRHSGPVPPVHFRFDGQSAVKLAPDGSVQEEISLGGIAIPEGPGLEIVVQAVPWRDGLRMNGVILDRWRGTGAVRNRAVSWAVEGRAILDTLTGRHETFRTNLAPVDGSFSIVGYITVARPHHLVRMEYVAAAGRKPLVSEMREVAFHCGALPAERIDG